MFARLFSNTVMGIGTFARLGPEPLTYHLKERERRREVDTLASHEDEKKEKFDYLMKRRQKRKVLIKSRSTETRTLSLILTSLFSVDTFLSPSHCFELQPEQTLITQLLTYEVQLSNAHDISAFYIWQLLWLTHRDHTFQPFSSLKSASHTVIHSVFCFVSH